MTIDSRMAALTAERVPFVRATVVRAQAPTSATPGARAIIHADGRIEGFVGGQCAEESVRTAALNALTDGDSLLLRILPSDDVTFPDTPGAKVSVNTCLSGGALEIFIEPNLPPPLLAVVGAAPVAEAIAAMADILGYAVARSADGEIPADAAACIVASHGHDEEISIAAALAAEVPYVALVASRKRGQAVLDSLDLSEELRAKVHTPAGLNIGAKTPSEVALSILAEFVTHLRTGASAPAAPVPAVPETPAVVRPLLAMATPKQVIDPICGMTVTVTDSTPHLRVGGEDFWFCCPGCRRQYAKQTGA